MVQQLLIPKGGRLPKDSKNDILRGKAETMGKILWRQKEKGTKQKAGKRKEMYLLER